MTTLSTTKPVAGTSVDATVLASNFTAIEAVINGSIDNTNIAAAALAVTKLTQGTNGTTLRTINSVPVWHTNPACGLYKTGNQTIVTATPTAVAWDAEQFDSGMHDTVTNNTRITVPANEGGIYLITANIYVTNSGTASGRTAFIYKNGASTHWSTYPAATATGSTITICTLMQLSSADYIEIVYGHNSAASDTIGGVTDTATFCAVAKIS